MDNYHVKKHESHWDLTREGGTRASISEPSKEKLLAAMQTFLEGKTASVKIHGEDGKIQEERTYPRAADPARTKG